MELFHGLRVIRAVGKNEKYSFEDKDYGPALVLPDEYLINNNLPNALLTCSRKDGRYSLNTGYVEGISPFANPFVLHYMGERDLVYLLNQNLFSHIIFTGGIDLRPEIYKGNPELAEDIDDRRDAFELFLFQEALRRGYPMLGICRGMQLLNVACSGTLKNVDGHRANDKKILPHSIKIGKASWLYSLYRNSLKVNSFHHQAVDKVGTGLDINAYSDDGVVEGFCNKEKRIFAVQWHPEEIESGKKIFKFFFKQ